MCSCARWWGTASRRCARAPCRRAPKLARLRSHAAAPRDSFGDYILDLTVDQSARDTRQRCPCSLPAETECRGQSGPSSVRGGAGRSNAFASSSGVVSIQMPTQAVADRTSQARYAKVLADSPDLRELVTTDRGGTRRLSRVQRRTIGDGVIDVVGTDQPSPYTGIDADLVILDEFDRMQPEVLANATCVCDRAAHRNSGSCRRRHVTGTGSAVASISRMIVIPSCRARPAAAGSILCRPPPSLSIVAAWWAPVGLSGMPTCRDAGSPDDRMSHPSVGINSTV